MGLYIVDIRGELEGDYEIIRKYEEPTTKNDLGVDAISRADARSLICEIDIKHHTFGISRKAFKDLYNGMDELPPVTPQEPTEKNFTKADIDAIVKAINVGWELRVNEVLDEIRSEIEQLSLHKAQYLTSDNKVCIDSQDVFNVIDKYKAEIEPQEGIDKE